MERFMELYETVYRDMYRLAYYYMGNGEDAEDAVQDAALSACEHFGALKKEESFRPWIFRILVNHCRKNLRKRVRKEVVLEDPQEAYEPGPGSRTEVLELLGTLSEEERLIVTLAVFGGYKGQEIAHMLNRNYSTVRTKYRRALKKLEQELTGKEGVTSGSKSARSAGRKGKEELQE